MAFFREIEKIINEKDGAGAWISGSGLGIQSSRKDTGEQQCGLPPAKSVHMV